MVSFATPLKSIKWTRDGNNIQSNPEYCTCQLLKSTKNSLISLTTRQLFPFYSNPVEMTGYSLFCKGRQVILHLVSFYCMHSCVLHKEKALIILGLFNRVIIPSFLGYLPIVKSVVVSAFTSFMILSILC